jgi:argininosuccinate lyase
MSTNPLDQKSQAWSGLFNEPMSELVQRYTASVLFDQRLWHADIQGSLAHAQMLCECGILSTEDFNAIELGMKPH